MASLRFQFRILRPRSREFRRFQLTFSRIRPFARFDQIEHIHSEVVHDVVGGLERKGALSMQDIVHVRLGNPNHPSQSALGEIAVANAISKQGDKSLLEVAEGHGGLAAIFLSEIGE
jgi:hypothetical protein